MSAAAKPPEKTVISTGAKVGERAERSGETSYFLRAGGGGGKLDARRLLRATFAHAQKSLRFLHLRSARSPTFAPVEMTEFLERLRRVAHLAHNMQSAGRTTLGRVHTI